MTMRGKGDAGFDECVICVGDMGVLFVCVAIVTV